MQNQTFSFELNEILSAERSITLHQHLKTGKSVTFVFHVPQMAPFVFTYSHQCPWAPENPHCMRHIIQEYQHHVLEEAYFKTRPNDES
jgi:hypothetical protein